MPSSIERIKQKLVGRNGKGDDFYTAGYETPKNWVWGWQTRNLPPFDFHWIRMMLIDPTIRLGLAMRLAPVCGMEIAYSEKGEDGQTSWSPGVKANSPEVAEFVEEQTNRFVMNDLARIAGGAQTWGWSAAEVIYHDHQGRIKYLRMEERHAQDVRVLEYQGKIKAVRFRNIKHSKTAEGKVDLKIPKAFWHGFRAESGKYYPEPILMGCYSPWFDKWTEGGALDVRRLFMHKDAYGGQVFRYPPGTTNISGKGVVPNRDIAREILEQAKAGAVIALPSSFDEGGRPMWDFQHATITASPTHVLQYPQDLDVEVLRGMEIPDDVLTAEAAGSWEGKRVPQNAFYNGLDVWVGGLLKDWERQIMTPLVYWNFGPKAEFELKHKPLALQAQEQAGEKDGEGEDDGFGGLGGMFGGGGSQGSGGGGNGNDRQPGGNQPATGRQSPKPPQQQSSQIHMSAAPTVDEIVGQGIMSAEEIVRGVRQRLGVWRTIGGEDDNQEDKGGARVFIEDGKITKGPKGMVGRDPERPSQKTQRPSSEKKKPLTGDEFLREKERWKNTISSDEREGLRNWTGNTYRDIRRYQIDPNSASEDVRRSAKRLESAIDKAPPYSGKVYRGMMLDEDTAKDMFSRLESSGFLTIDAHSSASKNRNVTDEFTGIEDGEFEFADEGQIAVVMEVESSNGADISDFNEREQEVLLRKGTRLSLSSLDYNPKSGIAVVRLTEGE